MMTRIRNKIKTIMMGDEKTKFISISSFLFLLSLLYKGAVNSRIAAYKTGIFKKKRLPCKIISIGNITVGGTGKTPLTIYIAELLTGIGLSVVVISRGYKGTAENTRSIVSDGQEILIDAKKSGDEPFMMAQTLLRFRIPVIVGKSRYHAGLLAIKRFKPDVILLDDAFQHLRIFRDINLVLLDGKKPFGNNYLLPRGVLREPISSLTRGDAFIFTRTDRLLTGSLSELTPIKNKTILDLPVFQTAHVPYISDSIKNNRNDPSISQPKDFGILKNRKVLAFSGIAGNLDFKNTIERFSCDIKSFIEFPDHHLYHDDDLKKITQAAREKGVDCILTTEKDYVKIRERFSWPFDLVIVGIKISFGDQEEPFRTFIKNRLEIPAQE